MFEKVFESAIALGATGEPIEIATVAVFLASDAANYITWNFSY
ncbi:MAG: SDR family oxidoreductase [Desulfobacteraceae bacterium]|nr:SDR family oxidoreductase [Desulfobacteraceae bacterium]